MFCTYCHATRPENEAPCPNCGAPSSLLGKSPTGNWGTIGTSTAAWGNASETNGQNFQPNNGSSLMNQWGNPVPQMPFNSSQQWDNSVPQLPFNDGSSVSWNNPSGNLDNQWGNVDQVPFNNGSSAQWGNVDQVPFNNESSAQWNNPSGNLDNQWGNIDQVPFNNGSSAQWDTGNQNAEQPQVDFSKALVPVSNQVPASMQPQQSSLPIIQTPTLEQLLPALPEDSVYVPPMYTKPRPLIPRYRIISGLISLIIVALLACGGVTYYAKASGTLGAIQQAFTGSAPNTAHIMPSTPPLPDPKQKPDLGPALGKIPAASLSASVDKQNTPLQPTQFFHVKQTIYLTCSVPPPGAGTVSAKWYMNGNYFQTITQSVKKTGDTTNIAITMQYGTAAEGWVELDWNGQMAQKLYFVVKN